MENLLKEIQEGTKERNKLLKENKYVYGIVGIGSKAYITKRIDLLREKLLEMKKRIEKE